MAIIDFGWRVPFDTKVLSAFAHVRGLVKVEVTPLKSANMRSALIDIGKSYIVFDSIIHQAAVARVKVTPDQRSAFLVGIRIEHR